MKKQRKWIGGPGESFEAPFPEVYQGFSEGNRGQFSIIFHPPPFAQTMMSSTSFFLSFISVETTRIIFDFLYLLSISASTE